MISAGISLPRALRILAAQTKNKKFHEALLSITEDIVKGKGFSESLAEHGDIFSEFFLSMVKVGEEGGTLEDVLKNLVRQMEREHELKSKITGALIYPAVIVFTMVGIGILMLVMVVPQLAKTFEELKIELPLTTKITIFIGKFFTERWYVVIAGFILFGIFFRIALNTKEGKKIIDNISLKIPIVSSIIKKINSAYTIRTLSSLIASGVPIVRSLEVVAGTMGNIHYKNSLIEATEKVRKGGKLAEALGPYENLYSLLVIQMIEVGEETGQTSDILKKLADFFEDEVTDATKNLTAIIEPVLMLIVGAAVGFFAVSMVQPMYSMMGTL